MDAAIRLPLSRFPGIRTVDPDELLVRTAQLFSVRSLDIADRQNRRLDTILNHRQLTDVGLTFVQYGGPIMAAIDSSEQYLQGLPLRGTGDASAERVSGTLSRTRGFVSGPGARYGVRYSADFEHLIVRIHPDGVVRKLAALIGGPVDPPLRLRAEIARNESQHRLVEFVVNELDRVGDAMPPVLLAEMEQAMIVAFLTNSRHNYSQLLNGEPRAAASWQVRRVEEYVRAHWDQPVTVEALATIAEMSARNLFYTFRKTHGISPIAFARRVRLSEARAMLSSPEPGATVTSVAFDCGFSNPGAFSQYYRASYGELPSETLRRAQGLAHLGLTAAAT